MSSITHEVIYSRNFDKIEIRSAQFDLYQQQILLIGKKDQIEYSPFSNEDRDAWKQYLKKGQIKQALEFCAAKQRPYVAGIYADQLFLKK